MITIVYNNSNRTGCDTITIIHKNTKASYYLLLKQGNIIIASNNVRRKA